MFGGNSNWRGPIWMPVNFLVVEALDRYARFFGDDLHGRVPDRLRAASSRSSEVAADLRERLISLFLVGADGRRPCFGWVDRLQHDPAWKDNVLFNEYFHGDNGAGLGAAPPDRLDGARRRADPPRRAACTMPTLGELMSSRRRRSAVTIRLGPQACGTLDEAAKREWLVADGVGGYAMGTVAGLRTRRYHGLLVVAVDGPAQPDARPRRARPGARRRRRALPARDRRVGRAAPSTRAGTSCSSRSTSTTACRAGAGRSAASCSSASSRWRTGRRRSASSTGCSRRDRPVRLELTPLCTWRSVHGERHRERRAGRSSRPTDGFVFERAYRVAGAGWAAGRRVVPRRPRARGGGARARTTARTSGRPARSRADLEPGALPRGDRGGRAVRRAAAAGGARSSRRRGARARELLARRGRDRRRSTRSSCSRPTSSRSRPPAGPTAVAGYPWFGEWSRDLMTSYEGLYLATNRADEGREVLRTSAATVSEGMLANTADTGSLEYNTVDGTLWFVHAVGRHVVGRPATTISGDELAPVLEQIVAAPRRRHALRHRASTRPTACCARAPTAGR